MTIDLEKIQQTLINRLEPSGWKHKLRLFLQGYDFRKVLEQLFNESHNGKRFTPVLKQLFSFLENCPYKDLKVIIVNQDPYNYAVIEGKELPCADGMAFSCSNHDKIQISLKNIYKELCRTIFTQETIVWDPDLKPWAKQGVLLLNSALTTQIGKVGTHYELWKPFVTTLLETINADSNPCVFIFMGAKAQEFEELITDDKHLKLLVTHPASPLPKGQTHWNSEDIFVKTNEFLKHHYNQTITW